MESVPPGGRVGLTLGGRLNHTGESLAVDTHGVGGDVARGGQSARNAEVAYPGDGAREREIAGGQIDGTRDGVASRVDGLGRDRVDHRPSAGGVAVGGYRQIQIGRLTAGEVVGTQVASGKSRVAGVVDDEFVGVAVATSAHKERDRQD